MPINPAIALNTLLANPGAFLKRNGARPVTLALGTPGVALLGYGLWRYLSSKRAAHAFEHAPAAP